MTSDEKMFLKSIYKINRVKGIYTLRSNLETDERNKYIDLIKKYSLVGQLDASEFATSIDPDDSDSSSQHFELPSEENPEADVQNIINKEAYKDVLQQLGYNVREIQFFNLLMLFDGKIHGVANYLMQRKNIALAKSLMPPVEKGDARAIKTLNADKIRMYLTRFMQKISNDFRKNKDLLYKKGLI